VQGEITALAVFTILGSADPPLEVSISCIGEGPVISVSPTQLDWGVCPVLSPISKTVLLSNESLIPAEFECALVRSCFSLRVYKRPLTFPFTFQAREKTIFTVEPVSSIISPEEKLQLTVTALIDDCLKYIQDIYHSIMHTHTHIHIHTFHHIHTLIPTLASVPGSLLKIRGRREPATPTHSHPHFTPHTCSPPTYPHHPHTLKVLRQTDNCCLPWGQLHCGAQCRG